MKPLRLAVVVCATLIPLAACGSDDGPLTVPDVSGSDVTMPSGSGGSNGSPIASAECQQIFLNFGTAASGVGASATNFEQLGKKLDAIVPDDLKDDAATYIAAYQKIGDVVKDSGGKFDDPKVAQAIAELTKSPGFMKASQQLGTWFASGCPSS
jgi:predicted small lipoprotein YifL